jgi:hypothetical protein
MVPDKFWEGIGGELADRWAEVSIPALIFWLGGLLAWARSRGGLDQLSIVSGWLDRQSTPVELAALLTVFLGIAASGVIVQRFATPVLRLLEGYWPAALEPLQRRLIGRVKQRAADDDAAWQRLAPLLELTAPPTKEQLSELAKLERRRHRLPSHESSFMPTRVGNTLRAAETRPADKYGLGAVAVWPRLWLVLPDASRHELLTARAQLDGAVGAVVWGLLFCGFAAWTWLAIPVGLVITGMAILLWVPACSEVFGDLLEASYDLHRTVLYQRLRWPLPTNPQQEHSQGERLTAYLWRGSDDSRPKFTPP